MTPQDVLVTAERAAASGDRVAFFAVLIILGIIGVIVTRYQAKRNEKQDEAFAELTNKYTKSLEDMTRQTVLALNDNTRVSAEQIRTSQSQTEAFKVISVQLSRLEQLELNRRHQA